MSALQSPEGQATTELPLPYTFTYKHVDGLQIEADVHVPLVPVLNGSVVLYLHGGAWLGGIRTDYPRALFHEFLHRGYTVVSADYRLVPEVGFQEQLDDIRSIGLWIQNDLDAALQDRGLSNTTLDTASVIVAGSSAGSLLAAFTSLSWPIKPRALLLIAGPTDLVNVRPLNQPLREPLKSIAAHIPNHVSHDFIESALSQHVRPNVPPPRSLQDFLQPRALLGLSLLKTGVWPAFLARGLVDGCLPDAKSVPTTDLEALSPVHFDLTGFPPTVQVIGDCDEAFELSQVSGFHDKLQQADVKSAMLVVPGASHGFESMSRVGDRVHNRFLTTACDIVEEFAMISFM
ncbi:hypothetical protein H2204_007564 [Knufia peltigerae]|uniref:Alpha/beta hydrolase fold-3 domain-containing protein n=1 Tax=Knufia peltigerae TaxID=1002370 RepID=A0AA39CVI7_9EURO|nr:hypothetical protein H2204_007564 [Knufia peltigerae]